MDSDNWVVEEFSKKVSDKKYMNIKNAAFVFEIKCDILEPLSISCLIVDGSLPFNSKIEIKIENQFDSDKKLEKEKEFVFTEENGQTEINFDEKYAELNEKGYINNDKIIFSLRIRKIDDLYLSFDEFVEKQAERSIEDQKKMICMKYSGLHNLGATCYLNSILQSFFHIPLFRKRIFSMDLNNIKVDSKLHNAQKKSELVKKYRDTIENLQDLFARLQLNKGSCSTENLTKALGMSGEDVLEQQDIQEFAHKILDSVGDASSIFKGKYRSYKNLYNINKKISLEEEFNDISLVVDGCDNLRESFLKYVEKEKLEGDNMYITEDHGMQEAIIGTEFLRFPDVLYLHLKRFAYDVTANTLVKINKRYEFPKEIDLKEFLAEDVEKCEDYNYELFGIIVHTGSPNFGHYYVYLRPTTENQWIKFNDREVSVESEESAIDDNYGGFNDQTGFEKSYSAYILVYVRKSKIDSVFMEVDDSEIPEGLREEIEEEDRKTSYLSLNFANNLLGSLNSSYSIMGDHNRPMMYMNTNKELRFNVYTEKSLNEDSEFGACWAKTAAAEICIKEKDTVEDLFDYIASLHLIDPYGELLIFSVSNDHRLQYVDKSSDENMMKYREEDGFFVTTVDRAGYYEQEKNILVFVYLYMPSIQHPLMLHKILTVSKGSKVENICYEVFDVSEDEDDETIAQYLTYNTVNENHFVLEDVELGAFIKDIAIGDATVLVLKKQKRDPIELDKRRHTAKSNENKEYYYTDYCDIPFDANTYISYNQLFFKVKVFYFPEESAEFTSEEMDFRSEEEDEIEIRNKIVEFPYNITGFKFIAFINSVFGVDKEFYEEDSDKTALLWVNKRKKLYALNTGAKLSEQFTLDSVNEITMTIASSDMYRKFKAHSRVCYCISEKGDYKMRYVYNCFVDKKTTVNDFVEWMQSKYDYNLLLPLKRNSGICKLLDYNKNISKDISSITLEAATIDDDSGEPEDKYWFFFYQKKLFNCPFAIYIDPKFKYPVFDVMETVKDLLKLDYKFDFYAVTDEDNELLSEEEGFINQMQNYQTNNVAITKVSDD